MTMPEDGVANDAKDTITFRNKESKSHRVIHADGVFGAVSSIGQAHISFYNERYPIPKTVSYSIDPDSGALLELESNSHHSQNKEVYREIEVSIVMNDQGVLALYDLLQKIIVGLDQIGGEGDSSFEPQSSK